MLVDDIPRVYSGRDMFVVESRRFCVCGYVDDETLPVCTFPAGSGGVIDAPLRGAE